MSSLTIKRKTLFSFPPERNLIPDFTKSDWSKEVKRNVRVDSCDFGGPSSVASRRTNGDRVLNGSSRLLSY